MTEEIAEQTIDGFILEDLESAENYMVELTLEIKDIERQLGDRDRRHADGSRMTAAEYWDWRAKAKSALLHRQRRSARIRQAIRRIRGDERGARELLSEVYTLLVALRTQDRLLPMESDLVQRVADHLHFEEAA